MGLFSNIQIALDTTLATVPSVPPIAWSNVDYKSIIGTMFIRPTLLPANASMATLNGAQKNIGIYQIDIFSPINVARSTSLALADRIKSTFTSSRVITANSDKIWILQIDLGKGERQDAWDHIFVDIHYNCIS